MARNPSQLITQEVISGMKQQSGFSLIELMIVLAIIAIIVGVGWPMYAEQSRANNRTDAIIATNAVALALTQFELDNVNGFVWDEPPGAVTAANAHNRYLPLVAVGPASDGGADDVRCTQRRGFRWVAANNRYESCRGLYSIAVAITPDPDDPARGIAFTITTTAIGDRPQRLDLECNSFTLTSNGVKGHIAIAHPDRAPEASDPLVLQPDPTSEGENHSTRRCWGSS